MSRRLAVPLASIVTVALLGFGAPTVAGADDATPTAAPVSTPDTSTSPTDPASAPPPEALTDPPADQPTTDPVPAADPVPTSDPAPPTDQATTTDPVAATDPGQEGDPIPQLVHRSPTPSAAAIAAAVAARAAAQREAAQRSAAYAAAQARLSAAGAAYDAARLAYASTKAEYDAALSRATLVHSLADTAASAAYPSKRVLAALVRELAQQRSGTATVDVLFGDRAGDNLLYQLGTLDKLAQLSGNLAAIRERVDADEKRARLLLEQDNAAQEAVRTIPVAEALAAMESAQAAFATASTELAALGPSGPASLAGLTPLKDLLAAADTGRLSDQGWAIPAIGRITDAFGPRPVRPLPGVGAVHYGTDIGTACGAAVYAATSGAVEAAGSLGTYGNWILINHGDGIETGYAHIAPGETLVAVGESVIAGQVIAGVGSTGASTGCHLHFEVRVDGSRVDPQSFLGQRGVVLGD